MIEEVRDSGRGGMAHACELETSLYLHLHPEAVDMSQAVDERGYAETEHAWMDWSDGPLEDHAVVVIVLRIRRAGRRQQGNRRQGREPCSRPQRKR